METLLTLLNKLKTLNKIKSFIKRKAKKYLNRVILSRYKSKSSKQKVLQFVLKKRQIASSKKCL